MSSSSFAEILRVRRQIAILTNEVEPLPDEPIPIVESTFISDSPDSDPSNQGTSLNEVLATIQTKLEELDMKVRDLIEMQSNIGDTYATNANVNSIKSDLTGKVALIQGLAAGFKNSFFDASMVQAPNQDYDFYHVILTHDLNTMTPVIAFYSTEGDSLTLPVVQNDSDSVIVNVDSHMIETSPGVLTLKDSVSYMAVGSLVMPS